MSDTYLRQVLAKYPARLSAKTVADSVKMEIERHFLNTRNVSYSGSYAKGTAIHTPNRGSDMDLFISVSTNMALKDLYEYTYQFALNRNWNPKRQNVSIGINHRGYEIDLVPGRIQDGYQNYHSLYVRRENTWKQTNISLHISTVSQSCRLEEIRLYKLWRNLHGLDYTSFLMELFAIESLKYRTRGDLASNFIHLIKSTRDNLLSTTIIDPSNTNNVISNNMTVNEKRTIANKASQSAGMQYWKDIVW